MITEEVKKEVVKKVLALMERQKFADWYVGEFEDYITGDMAHTYQKSQDDCKEVVLKSLEKMIFS